VQAESAVRMGGPVEGVGCKFAHLCTTTSPGSPRSYAVGTLRCLPELPKLILLTPPSRFSMVVSAQWPSLWLLQVLLVCCEVLNKP
jgi:hypothetical protein